MFRKAILSIVLFISTFILTLTQLPAQESEIIVTSKRVGNKIDQEAKLSNQNLSKPQKVSSNSEQLHSKKDAIHRKPGTAFYIELIGKGFISANIDFRIKNNHRFSFGITLLEYGVGENGDADKYYLSPGIMYYFINGTGPSYFEVGAGASATSHWNEDYSSESKFSLHGVIGYRYQKKESTFFRAGFTPFYRVNGVFVPLVGLSFGYSW